MKNQNGEELSGNQIHYGALAKGCFDKGQNPPDWVGDEAKWNDAKTEASKTYKMDDEAFWPVVVSIYEKMGGEMKAGAETQAQHAATFDDAHGVLECFNSQIEAGDAASMPREIMYAPVGTHTIMPRHKKTGKPIEVTVNVTPHAVGALLASRSYWAQKFPKQKMFADKNHKEEDATFWPASWRWDKARGILCEVAEWTKLGIESITGKMTRSFSPSVFTDMDESAIYADDSGQFFKIRPGKRGSKSNPAEITGAMFCVGTLTNKPAFGAMDGFFAENQHNPTAAAAANQTQRKTMRKVKLTKDREGVIAGTCLQFEDDVAQAIVSGGGGIYAEDAPVVAELQGQASKEKQRADELQKQVDRHNRAKAVECVNAAIARGAINPKQTIKQIVTDDKGNSKEIEVLFSDHLVELCCENPDMFVVVQGMAGKPNLTKRTVQADKRDTARPGSLSLGAQPIDAGVVILAEDCSVEEAVRGYCGIQAEVRKAERAGVGFEKLDEMRRAAGRIYNRHLSKVYNEMGHVPIQAEWLADIDMGGGGILADNSFGTLAATNIVAQETLLLLKKILLPFLKMSFDLSAREAVLNQVIYTRTRAIPVVNTYAGSGAYANSDYASVDASVTLSGWPYVQHTISVGTIAATMRNIFGEVFDPLIYALAKNIFETWTGVMTVANFDKTASLGRTGYSIVGTPDRKTLIGIDNDGDTLLWPEGAERIALLGTQTYNPLREDPYLSSYLYAGPESTARVSGDLGKRENLTIHKTQSFNGRADGVKGFGMIASATAVVVRVPTQVNNAMGINFPGVRDILTEPDTGLSILVTKFLQPDGSSGSVRGEALVGANVADPLAGICVL